METAAFADSFLAALSMRSPLLLIAVVGAVLSWLRVRPASRASHRVFVAGLLLLATHAIADAYSRAQNVRLAISGAPREEIFQTAALWVLTLNVLLILTIICLVVAVVVGRSRPQPLAERPEA